MSLCDASEIQIFLKSYIAPLESILCVISPKTFVVVIGMNTRRVAAEGLRKGLRMCGLMTVKLLRKKIKLLHLKKLLWIIKLQFVPPPMNVGEINTGFLNLSQAMNSQANVVTSQV